MQSWRAEETFSQFHLIMVQKWLVNIVYKAILLHHHHHQLKACSQKIMFHYCNRTRTLTSHKDAHSLNTRETRRDNQRSLTDLKEWLTAKFKLQDTSCQHQHSDHPCPHKHTRSVWPCYSSSMWIITTQCHTHSFQMTPEERSRRARHAQGSHSTGFLKSNRRSEWTRAADER